MSHIIQKTWYWLLIGLLLYLGVRSRSPLYHPATAAAYFVLIVPTFRAATHSKSSLPDLIFVFAGLLAFTYLQPLFDRIISELIFLISDSDIVYNCIFFTVSTVVYCLLIAFCQWLLNGHDEPPRTKPARRTLGIAAAFTVAIIIVSSLTKVHLPIPNVVISGDSVTVTDFLAVFNNTYYSIGGSIRSLLVFAEIYCLAAAYARQWREQDG